MFNFAVPLWLTRIRSDLVTTEDCSPTLYEDLLKYPDLHLEYFWRTRCYIYPPENGQYWLAFPIFFLQLPPNLTDYCGSTVHAYVYPFTGLVGTGRERMHKRYVVPNPIRSLLTGLRCRSKIFQNLMNFQLCRPAVTDPRKVRPCNYRGL